MVLTPGPDLLPARVASVELDREGDQARYDDLVQVQMYWDSKRENRFAPRRVDIDPADVKELLPRIMLVDVCQDGSLDFRFRLSGTAINTILNGELTGKRPSDLIPPAYGAMIHDHYCLAVRQRQPLVHIVTLDSYERSLTYVRLLLPLSEDGEHVTMLISVHSKHENARLLREFFCKARTRGAGS